MGLSRTTIDAGLKEIATGAFETTRGSVCKSGPSAWGGGGRKRLTEKNPKLRSALDRLIEPMTGGDPENPRR